MAVDTGIYNALIADRKSVADYDAIRRRAMAEQQALETGQMNALMQRQKVAEYEAGQRERETVRNALLGLGAGATDEQRIQALKGTATPTGFSQADALEKMIAERRKTDAEINYKGAQTAKEFSAVADAAVKRYRTALDFIDTPQAAARWMQAQYADPVLSQYMQSMGPADQAISRIPQDPQGFEQWRQRAGLGMEAFIKKLQEDAKIAETQRNNKATVAATIRGQDVSAATQRRGQDMTAATAGARLAYDKEKDAAEAASGKNITEGERLSGGYAARMEEATKLLDKLEADGRPGYTQQVAGAVPFVGNAARVVVSDDAQQKYRQAQEDWVRAKLRRESGAAIGNDEMAREIQAYFPQPGEGEEVVLQKRRSRAIANEAMKKAAGRGSYTSQVPDVPKAPKVMRFDKDGNLIP